VVIPSSAVTTTLVVPGKEEALVIISVAFRSLEVADTVGTIVVPNDNST